MNFKKFREVFREKSNEILLGKTIAFKSYIPMNLTLNSSKFRDFFSGEISWSVFSKHISK